MGQVTRTNFGCVATVIIPNASIITLPSLPVVIVPAIAGGIIWPMLGVFQLHWAVDYGAIDATASIRLGHAGVNAYGGGITEVDGDVSALLAAGHDATGYSTLPTFPQDLSNSWGYTYSTADIRGQALSLFADNGAGVPFSGGDPANTLTVTVFYAVTRS